MTDTIAPPEPELRPWRITWRGRTWTESDLKGRHLSIMFLLTGRDDFDQVELDPRLGHQRLMLVISALLVGDVEDTGDVERLVAESRSEVANASVEEIYGALSYIDD